MPLEDKTGPAGWGPMTGRGMGYCAGYGVPGSMNSVPVRGRGMRGGGGRGFRNRFFATGLPGWMRAGNPNAAFPNAAPFGPAETAKEEKDFLGQQATFLKKQLADLEERIASLEKEKQP